MEETAHDTVARIKGIPTKAELEELMQAQSVIVTFTKLDGDERTMILTHDLRVIPEENHPKGIKEPHKQNITGWNELAEGWRSCRYDRVKSVITDPLEVAEWFGAAVIQQEIDAQIVKEIKEKMENGTPDQE